MGLVQEVRNPTTSSRTLYWDTFPVSKYSVKDLVYFNSGNNVLTSVCRRLTTISK